MFKKVYPWQKLDFSFYLKLLFIGVIFFTIPYFVSADYRGQITTFFVNSSYDLDKRPQIEASLVYLIPEIYFYVDDKWWNVLGYDERNDVILTFKDLGEEFKDKIYPILTSNFGKEWNPGIDNDPHLTVLVHPMHAEAGGYFNNSDEYSRFQATNSNEREMIYLNSKYVVSDYIESFFAHEFMHLITFNQKERKQGIQEEIWLNEARSEFASTLVGYDTNYERSNLQSRVRNFIDKPSDSITEWKSQIYDYGVLNLFVQYLVDHYGVEILADSLKFKEVGIASLNKALAENGFEEDFSQIFTDWTITVFVNDCDLGLKYCYLNENLKNLKVVPSTNYLPLSGESSLSLTERTKNWAGNWYKFVGGQKKLKIEFIGNPNVNFKVPYLTEDFSGNYSLGFFQFDEKQKGEILIPDFGTKVLSLVIIPSIQTKESDFDGSEEDFAFFWQASTINEQEPVPSQKPVSEMTKAELEIKIMEVQQKIIEFLKQLIEITMARIANLQSY
ncbi:hypothetical protein ACFL0A_00930 [Patescibacteria group bacterium]